MFLKLGAVRKALGLACALFLGLTLACGGGGNAPPPAPTAAAPTIATQPANQTAVSGGTATFTVSATANGTLSYQWKKNATDLAGQTASGLTLSNVGSADVASYTVVVTNTLGGTTASTTSNAATLTLNEAPAIATIPDQTVVAGLNVTFTASATGSGTLSYQWKKGGVDLTGETARTLAFTPATLANAGSYTVQVTNTLNGTTTHTLSNAAALNVNPAPAMPSISAQPLTQSILEGGSVTLTVTASASNGSLSYQWKKGGTDLVGKTSSSLTLNPVLLSDAGSYTVAVINTLSGTTATTLSSAAVLTVNPIATAPAIGTQPLTQTVTEGANVSLSVAATGNGILSYQWKKDGVDLSGKNLQTLDFSPVTAADAGSYTVLVTNSLNGTTATTLSSAAVLTVNPPGAGPTITTQPAPATAIVPASATFTVEATASGTITYQWKKNGTVLSGETGASYSTPATSLQELSATYTVDVTANGTTVTSNAAALTVAQPDPTYAGDPVAQSSVGPLNIWEYVTTYSTRGAFRLGYHEALMNPLWTSYCTYKVANPFTAQGSRNYRPDPRSTTKVGDSDFTNTNYTRGHQVLMADMELRYGGQAGTDTCFTTNLAPQIAAHNNNIWNSLEQEVSGSYNTGTLTWSKAGLIGATDRMWITTGPIFTNTPVRRTTTTGTTGKQMAIPDAFYKIMIKEVAGKPKALAILTPHEPTPLYSSIADYITSIERIETLSGLNLYPNLPGTAGEIQQFKSTVDMAGWGAPFEKTSGPNVHMIEPSWDLTVSAGTTVNFVGAASSTTGTVSNPTWTFGSEGNATGYTTTHTFNTAGSVSVSFAITDGAPTPLTNTITRVITVTSGNAAPAIGAIGAQSAVLTAPLNVAFTVNDDSTPKNSLVVTATSNNQAVLQDAGIVVTPADATTGIGNLQLTGTGTVGSATVTVRVTDASSASATTTFTFTVTDGNTAPVITGLAEKTTGVDTPITVNFTVSDAETTDAGTLTVTATSSDTTLIPGTLTVTNTAGACALTLSPGTGLSGSATITITVTDGGKSKTGTFGLTVGTPAAPALIISQYYEGTTTSRFIEITNIGATTINLASPQIYLVVYANPTASTDFTTIAPNNSDTLSGTLAPGESKLYMQSGSSAPSYALSIATVGNALGINGNDPILLSLSKDAGTAWTKRFDFVGLTDGTNWGKDLSLVRNANVLAPNASYTASEWTQKTIPVVDSAATGTTERLGEHIYNH